MSARRMIEVGITALNDEENSVLMGSRLKFWKKSTVTVRGCRERTPGRKKMSQVVLPWKGTTVIVV